MTHFTYFAITFQDILQQPKQKTETCFQVLQTQQRLVTVTF